jgi:hypothetical protein
MNISFFTMLKKLSLLPLLFCITLGTPVYAAISAGQVEAVKGTAWAQLPGEESRKLEKGAPIFQSDVVKTEKDSTVQLLFNDQTKFFLGTDTEMNIEKFNNQGTAEEKGFTSRVIKGTFRFVTGLIAREKPESMEVNTSVATIGIRGTHVVGETDATSATIILLEPEDMAQKTSIVVANQYGKVTIDEPGYGTEVPDQFSPPSPPRRMRLETINNIMRSMQSIQRMNIPRPPRMQ